MSNMRIDPEKLPASDVTLLGIEWVNEERDLRLRLRLPYEENEAVLYRIRPTAMA